MNKSAKHCFVQEMIITKPNKNESFVTYGNRILRYRGLIVSKLESMNLPLAKLSFIIEKSAELEHKMFMRLIGRIQEMFD